MASFVTVLFACFFASYAAAVPPAAAGLAELQAALGEGGLEDAQEVGLALRRLRLATVLEVGAPPRHDRHATRRAVALQHDRGRALQHSLRGRCWRAPPEERRTLRASKHVGPKLATYGAACRRAERVHPCPPAAPARRERSTAVVGRRVTSRHRSS
jgi:hypothetical protein